MIVFRLTMPNRGSWNGKWSQENRLFVRCRTEAAVPKELWDRSFYYRWPDGWTACVSTERRPAKEARKLQKKSAGFFGYDWMITSIIRYGEIRKPEEGEKNERSEKHMTNEEAAGHIKDMCSETSLLLDSNRRAALNMAVRMLEQTNRSCVDTGNMVDQQEAIESVAGEIMSACGMPPTRAYEIAERALKKEDA